MQNIKQLATITAFCFGLVVATGADAAAVTVTNSGDNAVSPPAGSLRAALLASASGDTITFACGAPCTITLAAALPPITHNLTIDGGTLGNVVIDGASQFPGFFVDTGTVTLAHLQIRNAVAQGGAGNFWGGEIGRASCRERV